MSSFLRLVGLVEMSMTPRNHYSWLWIHQVTQKLSKKSLESFLTNMICRDKSLRSVLSLLENLEDGSNIFKKHDMEIMDFPTLRQVQPAFRFPPLHQSTYRALWSPLWTLLNPISPYIASQPASQPATSPDREGSETQEECSLSWSLKRSLILGYLRLSTSIPRPTTSIYV